MKKLCTSLGVLGLAAAGVILSAGVASAAGARPAVGHARIHAGNAHMPLKMPPAGYTVVETGPFTAPAGTQTTGSATCPGTRQAIGGGAMPDDNNTSIDINSSYPADGHSWVVWVNNNEAAATRFDVWVMCIRANAGYTVVTTESYANAGATDYASVSCPAKTVVVGGGAAASGTDLGVGINSSVGNSLGHGQTDWTAAMSNTSSSGDPFEVLAICRPRPLGYAMVTGPPKTVAPGGTAEVWAVCPGNSLPLSGGGFTAYQTTDSGLAFNGTFTSLNEWVTLWENSGSIARSAYPTVICAGT
jgi:hypothetical protein